MSDNNGAYINASKALADMDLTTEVGLTCGFTMMCTAIFSDDSPEIFINPATTLFVMGATSIGDWEHPRKLDMPLNSLLPPSKRIRYVE